MKFKMDAVLPLEVGVAKRLALAFKLARLEVRLKQGEGGS
jgi:hypothetical protein